MQPGTSVAVIPLDQIDELIRAGIDHNAVGHAGQGPENRAYTRVAAGVEGVDGAVRESKVDDARVAAAELEIVHVARTRAVPVRGSKPPIRVHEPAAHPRQSIVAGADGVSTQRFSK